jgi:hypothetical protein
MKMQRDTQLNRQQKVLDLAQWAVKIQHELRALTHEIRFAEDLSDPSEQNLSMIAVGCAEIAEHAAFQIANNLSRRLWIRYPRPANQTTLGQCNC